MNVDNAVDIFEEKLLEKLEQDFNLQDLKGVPSVHDALIDYIEKNVDTANIIADIVEDERAENASDMRVEQLEKLDEETSNGLFPQVSKMTASVVKQYEQNHADEIAKL